MMKALVTIVVVIISGIIIGTSASNFVNKDNDKRVLSTQSEQAHEAQDVAPMPGVPVTVRIPSINVDAKIESVAMDTKGRMDVPKDADNTAWFNPGYRPGQDGSAVLAGHFDKEDGSPAVFADITKLQEGDEIIVTDDKGDKKTFAVIKLAKYPYDDFPIKDVFGNNSGSMLNLITCHGEWNKETKNYSERMVVYSKLVE